MVLIIEFNIVPTLNEIRAGTSKSSPMHPAAGKPLLSSLFGQGAAGGVSPWIAVSAAAHVAFVTMVPAKEPPREAARPVTTELAYFEVPAEEPPAAPPPVPVAAPAERRVETQKPLPETPSPVNNPVADRIAEPEAPLVAQSTTTQSTEGGLAVAAAVGTADSGGATHGARLDGETGTNVAATIELDPGPFRRRYVLSINRLIPKPDVPRSLQQEAIDAVTVIGLTLDPEGHVIRVRVARSSGSPRFDEAALSFYQSHQFALPAPPVESQWETREVPLPIRWRS